MDFILKCYISNSQYITFFPTKDKIQSTTEVLMSLKSSMTGGIYFHPDAPSLFGKNSYHV